jgi:phosphoglycerate dehydrogenase-like enzyme
LGSLYIQLVLTRIEKRLIDTVGSFVYRRSTAIQAWPRRRQIEFEGQLVMDKTVGLVGLGIMGGAIARNLVSRGWRVIGFDVDAARRAELSRDNVNIADNASQVARCDHDEPS